MICILRGKKAEMTAQFLSISLNKIKFLLKIGECAVRAPIRKPAVRIMGRPHEKTQAADREILCPPFERLFRHVRLMTDQPTPLKNKMIPGRNTVTPISASAVTPKMVFSRSILFIGFPPFPLNRVQSLPSAQTSSPLGWSVPPQAVAVPSGNRIPFR